MPRRKMKTKSRCESDRKFEREGSRRFAMDEVVNAGLWSYNKTIA